MVSNKIKVQHSDSIAHQLIRKVLFIYFLLVLITAGLYMTVEYLNTKESVLNSLQHLHETSRPAIANAVWDIYVKQINSQIEGLVNLPLLKGISIFDPDGVLTYSTGVQQTDQNSSSLISYANSLEVMNYDGETEKVGTLIFYSDHSVILERVKTGLIMVVLNSILLMMALWFIFNYYIEKLLKRPLSRLTEATHSIDMEYLPESGVDVQLEQQNELKDLENAFNQMLEKLRHSRNELEISYQEMEQRVADRTEELSTAKGKLIIHQQQLEKEIQNKNVLMNEVIGEKKKTDKLNTELIDAKIKAEAASEAKSNFLSTMSHELRTPMNGMLGMAELLRDTKLTTEQKEYLDIINHSGQSLLNIINDILDFSKIEVGKMNLEIIPFDLEYLIVDVVKLLQPKAEDKGIELIIDYPLDFSNQFMGDAGRLRQILMNLVGNAIKFTDSGYALIKLRFDLFSHDTANLKFEIIDTGIGIEKEQLKELFSAFTQADTSTTRKYGGTGLGLTISKKLVELMAGEIGVESEVNKGTTFWFKINLPIIKSEHQNYDYEVLKGIKLLIVDDYQVNRDIVTAQLTKLSIEVESAENAESAMEKLLDAEVKKESFDIAILDYNLPKTDGELLAKRIKSHAQIKDTILILYTSSPKVNELEHYKRIGFSGFISKPMHSTLLTKTIISVLNSRKQEKDTQLVTRHSIAESEYINQKTEHSKDGFKTTGTILIAEDVKVNQVLATKMLTKFGLQVEVADNGQQAIEKYQANDYDLIFMDCQMPVKNGFDATKEIRLIETKIKKHIPIIALTANAMKEDKDKCYESGMDDFITKPFKAFDLQRAIKKWIHTKHIE